ncbi:hypothetical protein O181_038058 [Austropuccinia psidii MF-1]|uniref:Uncharacterized protein n=1 Tax=Austropuccinia psidii MF-1 TaxID=1389203 RepID=A0A9Q3DCL9_9BASI|nr:hypothetical protein [Austropuccinia psidii MF-1]
MNIVHQDGNICKDADRLRRCLLQNDIEVPDYVPEEAYQKVLTEGISVTDPNTNIFEEVRNSYTHDTNCSILCQLITKDSKYNSLIHALDEIWKK